MCAYFTNRVNISSKFKYTIMFNIDSGKKLKYDTMIYEITLEHMICNQQPDNTSHFNA